MTSGVPPQYESPLSDSLAVSRLRVDAGSKIVRVGLLLLGMLSTFIFTSSALSATATITVCQKRDGQIRIVAHRARCERNETKLWWNTSGTTGVAGSAGATGSNGTIGSNGAAGATGNNGLDDVTGATGNNGSNGATGAT